jgi:DNA-directed RNA polymerase specialized sigma24 family protein
MDKKSNNWAHRRKLALEKLGDNLLRSAEETATLRQSILQGKLAEVIEKELAGINPELQDAVMKRFLKDIPKKPLAAMVDVALEKISKKISEPANPF